MKKALNLYFSLLTAILSVIGCSDKKKGNAHILSKQDSMVNADTSFLADKNFIYKNTRNTKDIKFTAKLSNGKIYTDTTYKTAFVELTESQRIQLIAPFVAKEMRMDETYVKGYMLAYFISKQNKIAEFQPVIIEIIGNDYSSLILIVLDKNNKPVDGLNLENGNQGNYVNIDDSLTRHDKACYSYLDNDVVTKYEIIETNYKDAAKKDIIIDSNVFVSTISQIGKITTKQVVKAHFKKAK
jgi:hypothetical protein